MSEPGFAREVSAARAEQVSAVTGLLTGMSVEGVEVLRDSLRAEAGAERL